MKVGQRGIRRDFGDEREDICKKTRACSHLLDGSVQVVFGRRGTQ